MNTVRIEQKVECMKTKYKRYLEVEQNAGGNGTLKSHVKYHVASEHPRPDDLPHLKYILE